MTKIFHLLKSSLLIKFIFFFIVLLFNSSKCFAQLYTLNTHDLRLIYYGVANKYLVNYVAQCYENAMGFTSKLYGYTPSEKTTVLMHDLNDYVCVSDCCLSS